MQRTLREKIFSILLMAVMFLQSLSPYLALIKPTFASEPTPSETSTNSDSEVTPPPQEENLLNSQENVDLTPSETPTPTSEVPTPEVTLDPTTEELVPTPTEVVQPSETGPPADASTAEALVPTPEVAPTGDILDGISVTATPTATPSLDNEGTVVTEVVEANACFANSLNGCVATDKEDYHPNEVALIYGHGFEASTEYTLVITSETDGYNAEYKIKTDEAGSFFYSYRLENVYRPLYKVEVKDSEGNVVASTTFTDSPDICNTDIQGVNDQPGQKDLTKMCANYTSVPTSITSIWNWDEINGSGVGSTYDACSLFDTNGNGLANYSVCVSVSGIPLVQVAGSPTVYSCNDAYAEKCGGNALVSSPYTTSCSVSQTSTDPFAAGDANPKDTTASCTIQLSEVGGINSKLLDVCSYPSSQPNSSPSDCIVASTANQTGTLTVTKNLVPSNDAGKFNLLIDSNVFATDIGNTGTTGPKILSTGSHTVAETAGTGTNLSSYSSSISCVNSGGTVVASGAGSSLAVNLANNAVVVCTITNTLQNGSVKVNKIVDANGNGFNDEGTQANENTEAAGLGFTWNIDTVGTNAMGSTVSSVTPTSHNINESTVSNYHFVGWYPTSSTQYNCSNPQGTTLPASVTITSNQTTEITLCNKIDNGTIIVHKDVQGPNGEAVTDLASHPQVSLDGATGQLINENFTVTYNNVPAGSHTITESFIDSNYTLYGISETPGAVGTPAGLVVNVVGGQTVDVYVTNRQKSGTITVVKDVVNAAGGAVSDTHSFTANLNPGTQSDSFAEGDNAVFTVNPGTYTVTETDDPAYLELGCLTATGKTDIVVVSGGQGSVTCTNQQNAGTISGFKFNADGQTGILGWTVNLYSCLADFDLANCILQASTSTDGTGFFSFSNLNVGFYKVQEVVQAGWTALTSIFHNVTVTPGSTSTSNNFTNFENVSITVCKDSDSDGDAQTEDDRNSVFGWEMTLTKDEQEVGSQETDEDGCTAWSDLGPGEYSVTEETRENWRNLNPTTHDFGTVESGETYTHTFVNVELGTINITKGTDPAGNDGTFFDFSGDLDGSVTSGAGLGSAPLLPGQYSVTEAAETGWDLTGISCTDVNSTGDLETRTATFNLEAGENVTCTFANTKNGHLLVHKVTNPSEVDQTFLVTASGGTVVGSDSTLINADRDQYGDFEVEPGTYSVAETSETGWTETDNNCTNIEVAAGETEECTITNTQYGSITIEKQTNPDESTQDFNFTGDVAGTLSDGEQVTIDVVPGTYTSTEDQIDGWNLDTIICSDRNSTSNTGDGTATFNVEPGEDVTCIFTNVQEGKVIVTKYEDLNGNGEQDENEPTLPDWDINLDDATQTTGQDGTTTFEVEPGEFVLSEEIKEGWTQTNISCQTSQTPPPETTSNNLCHKTSSAANPWNAISVPDNNPGHEGHEDDYDYNGPVDANGHPAQGNGADKNDPTKDGEAWCAANVPQIFTLIPVAQAVETTKDPIDNDNNYPVQVDAGTTTTCEIGNQAPAPVLTIVKTNNTGGADKLPGQDVLFTLTVTATDSAVLNTEVIDLPAGGFTYRPGSWTANSSERGDLKAASVTTEPTYASPGTWNLGDMVEGEVVTLTYVADIADDQQTGLYKDLAWTEGESLAAAEVLGNESTGTFVGTDVNVISEPTTDTLGINVKREEKKEGDVLGAYLPATGADSALAMLGMYSLAAGFVLVLVGLLMRSKKLKIGKYIAAVAFAFALSLSLGAVQSHAATNLSVRLYEPDSTSNNVDLKLNFVTLDTLSRGITAQCFKKGPSDAVFGQFGSDINVAPASGNNGNCVPGAAVLSATGTYSFFVRVTAGADTVDSSIESVDFVAGVSEKPGTPYNYGKSQIESCKYRISFHTANDGGKTVKVVLYRSENTSFGIDDSNKVGELVIGSNAEGYIDNTLPDCNKTYYYAIRAYDLFGKGSDVVGDNVTVTITEGGTTTTTNAATGQTTGGALPAGESQVEQPAEGEVATEGEEVLGEQSDKAKAQKTDVLGITKEKTQSLLNTLKDNPVATGVGTLVLAILIYAFIKKNPLKKRN